jgi:hypothetical protein
MRRTRALGHGFAGRPSRLIHDMLGQPSDCRARSIEEVTRALRRHGYETDGAHFPTGRPDRATLSLVARSGLPVVAKLYPSGGGDVAYANMQQLWRSSFGERRRPPGLPEPIEYLPDVGALIMELLPGRPLVELGAADGDMVDEATSVVAALHGCDVQPGRHRSIARIVRSVRRKVDEIAEVAPQFAGSLREVADALEGSRVEEPELAPCHGDFSPRNVLVSADRLALIDWDRLQRADPARDLAYFGAYCWTWALRQRKRACWSILDRMLVRYNALRPIVSIEDRLGFHIAAGLVRIAHGLLTLWSEDYLVPRVVTEALRVLR